MATKLAHNQLTNAPVKPFETMAAAIADTNLVVGDILLVKDRADSVWDVVLSSGVTENTYNIVQCTGVGTLSLVLRVVNNTYIPREWGAKGDNSTDDYGAIAAMVAAAEAVEAINNTSVVFDFASLWYKLSQPLLFTDLDFMEIRGNPRFISTHTGDYVLKFSLCSKITIPGQIYVYGNGGTTFSTRQNLFGIVFSNCSHISVGMIVGYYFIAETVRCTGTTSNAVFKQIDVGYSGSGKRGVESTATSTISSQVQNGSINSAAQRSVVTMSAVPQQLKDYLDADVDGVAIKSAYFAVNGKCHWIESYSGSTVTVWPWVSTAEIGSTVDWIFGAGFFSTGGDTSVIRIDAIAPIQCGVGYCGFSLYPASIGALTTQNCGIGLLYGYATSSAAEGLNIALGYFEANIFDIIQGGQADNTFSMARTVSLNFAKVQRLYSGSSTGTPQVTRLTSASITDDYGFTYVTVAGEQIDSSQTLRLWTPEDYFIYANTATITLSDDVDFRRVFQRRTKILYWYGELNGMTPSGSLTFTPPSGGTINGLAIDTSQVFNTASGPAGFLVTCSSTDGLTWFVEPLAASTVTKA